MVAAVVCLRAEMLRLISARIHVTETSGQITPSELHQPHAAAAAADRVQIPEVYLQRLRLSVGPHLLPSTSLHAPIHHLKGAERSASCHLVVGRGGSCV